MIRREFLWIGIIVFLIGFQLNSCNKNKKQEKEITNLENTADNINQSLTKYRNSFNEEIATNKLLKTKNQKTFEELRTSNEQIIALQDKVRQLKLKPGNSITSIVTSTNTPQVIIKTISDTIELYDTIYIGHSFAYQEPNEWFSFYGFIGDDFISIDSAKIVNKFFLTISQENKKWYRPFKDVQPTIELHSLNPFTTTNSLIGYQLDIPKQKRLGLGLSTGVAVTNNGISPYIGVGLNYTLIYF